ncbi:hypothetical protein B0I35DRAFT_247525 [Stachybotrys elegans]|uniref:Uncharacterized protein n=1 Tax=Stachybotrys elegans TaxID=80388 RepID=A0A8K0SV34_9HYPO|nr:hypothetical protein B0I35DRAFT_247525 [Stachybotrys elegans]
MLANDGRVRNSWLGPRPLQAKLEPAGPTIGFVDGDDGLQLGSGLGRAMPLCLSFLRLLSLSLSVGCCCSSTRSLVPVSRPSEPSCSLRCLSYHGESCLRRIILLRNRQRTSPAHAQALGLSRPRRRRRPLKVCVSPYFSVRESLSAFRTRGPLSDPPAPGPPILHWPRPHPRPCPSPAWAEDAQCAGPPAGIATLLACSPRRWRRGDWTSSTRGKTTGAL